MYEMSIMEIIVFLASMYCSYKFLVKWYKPLLINNPLNDNKPARYILGFLPVGALCVILFTLNVLASFDVVESFIYILMYVALGGAWLLLGIMLMSCVFDLSWRDDALNLHNKAALVPVVGGFLGLTLIYSGANIGDGPGWWCVVFAGGLGLVAWFVLGRIINIFTKIFERITVERDIGCGIRFGAYLLASGIILARACAGDWTSFAMTIIEFMDGWPVLALAGITILVERYYISKDRLNENGNFIFGSILWGVLFIVLAAAIVYILPPTNENLIYRTALEVFNRSSHI